ncbi:MAG: hypothetical protein K2N99_01130, partial [Malacoplasma sp.]|nr:hypothetical protein [Malacoplasma sp.]
YKVTPEIAALYDTNENVEFVENFMKNYTFDAKTNIVKKKDGKGIKTVKEYEVEEYSYYDVDEKRKNPLKLNKKDYENNKWTDDYIWSKNTIGPEQIGDEDASSSDLVNYINTIQKLEGEFDKEDFIMNQCKNKSSFDTSKSKVYRVDDTTIVREFVSKNPVVIGDVYIMILKQMPSEAFSAHSLGSMTPLGLPNKSVKKSEVGKPYGDTANQFSEMDNVDLMNLVDPKKIARLYAVQSTNPQLRSECAQMLLFSDPTKLHDLDYTDDEVCTDTIPARQLVAYLSAIGLEIGDMDEQDPYEFLDNVKYDSLPKLFKKAGITETNNPYVNIKEKVKKTS